MDLQLWKTALVDFSLLFAVSWGFSLCTFATVVIGAGQTWSLGYLLFDTTRGAGIGASAGLCFIERLGARTAIAAAVSISCGIVSREWLANFVKDVLNGIAKRFVGVNRGTPQDPPAGE